MQHTDELLQVLQGDTLRRELSLKILFDVVETVLAIQHAQDSVFFFMEAEVVQPDGSLMTQ